MPREFERDHRLNELSVVRIERVACRARVTGDDGPSGHIVLEGTLDLGHATTGADEREFFVFPVAKGLSGPVDRSVQLAGQVGPHFVFRVGVRGWPIREALWWSGPKFENDGVRYGASLGWPMRRSPSS